LKNLLPLIRIDLLDGCCRARDASVVHEDIDTAERLRRLGDHRFDLAAVADIANATLNTLQFRRGHFQAVRVYVADVDVVSGFQKSRRDMQADAGSSGRDENFARHRDLLARAAERVPLPLGLASTSQAEQIGRNLSAAENCPGRLAIIP
jgi:hypothetical protein